MQVETKHSKGNWSVGKSYGSVITDSGDGFPETSGHSEVDSYGGYLICESVLKPADRKLIAAAPDLLEALMMVNDADNDVVADGLFESIPPLPKAKILAAIKKAVG